TANQPAPTSRSLKACSTQSTSTTSSTCVFLFTNSQRVKRARVVALTSPPAVHPSRNPTPDALSPWNLSCGMPQLKKLWRRRCSALPSVAALPAPPFRFLHHPGAAASLRTRLRPPHVPSWIAPLSPRHRI